MKRGILFLLVLSVTLLLCACGAPEQNSAETPATKPATTQQTPAKPAEDSPEATDAPQADAPQAEAPQEDITAFFPEDWEGRYTLVERDGGVLVYCKKACETDGENMSLLFAVYHITGDMLPPDYFDLGMYEGYPVYAVMPWSIPQFSSKEANDEYTDMIYEVGDILDDIQEYLNGGLDLDDYTVNTQSISGVYRLDTAEWTQESKDELLPGISQHSFISIDNAGGLYFFIAQKTTTGTAMTNENFANTDEPNCLVILSDGVVHPAYWLQGVLTVHGMQAYTDGAGNSRTDWTYVWESGEFWTEESLRDDIG